MWRKYIKDNGWFYYGLLGAVLGLCFTVICLLITLVLNNRPHWSHSTISLFTALVFIGILFLTCNRWFVEESFGGFDSSVTIYLIPSLAKLSFLSIVEKCDCLTALCS